MDKLKKRKGHPKIIDRIKHNLYTLIPIHPQVVQSPIYNDFILVIFDDQTEPQTVPNVLHQTYIRELHNILVRDPNYGGPKKTRYEENNIIISDSTLQTLLPTY